MTSSVSSVFSSKKGEAAYLAAYDRSLAHWPVPTATRFVDTSFGETHVVVAGEASAPPVVLLHGAGASSTMWGMNIASLAARHRVYAVDVLGDLGKSRPRRRLRDRGSVALWLGETLDGLDLETTAMVGFSMGSFVTASYALLHPARLERIALLAPAGVVSPLAMSFVLRALLLVVTVKLGFTFYWRHFLRVCSSRPDALDPAVGEQMVVGFRHQKWSAALPIVAFSDRELESLTVPTLVVVGENENVNRWPPRKALARADDLVPRVETLLLPEAVHLWTGHEADLAGARLLDFLGA